MKSLENIFQEWKLPFIWLDSSIEPWHLKEKMNLKQSSINIFPVKLWRRWFKKTDKLRCHALAGPGMLGLWVIHILQKPHKQMVRYYSFLKTGSTLFLSYPKQFNQTHEVNQDQQSKIRTHQIRGPLNCFASNR